MSKLYPEATQNLRTIRDLLRFAMSRFEEAELVYGHGSINAFDEASYLLLSTLRLPLDQLDPFFGRTHHPIGSR